MTRCAAPIAAVNANEPAGTAAEAEVAEAGVTVGNKFNTRLSAIVVVKQQRFPLYPVGIAQFIVPTASRSNVKQT